MTKKPPRVPKSQDDDALFESAMRDIRPLRKKPARSAVSAPRPGPAVARATFGPPKQPNAGPGSPAIGAPASPASEMGKGLDRRSHERLRKGRLDIESRLDLHGHTQADAHRALHGFIHRAYQRGQRCVLVITGKGGERGQEDGIMPNRGKGVLRRQVPLWLEGELGPMVLAIETARPQHGGDGAFYVLLRRQRNGGRDRC